MCVCGESVSACMCSAVVPSAMSTCVPGNNKHAIVVYILDKTTPLHLIVFINNYFFQQMSKCTDVCVGEVELGVTGHYYLVSVINYSLFGVLNVPSIGLYSGDMQM